MANIIPPVKSYTDWTDLNTLGLDYETLEARIKELRAYCRYELPYAVMQSIAIQIEEFKLTGEYLGVDDDIFFTCRAHDSYFASL